MASGATDDPDDDAIILGMMEGDQNALRLLSAAYGGIIRALLKRKYGDRLADPEIDEAMNVAAYNAFRFAGHFDKHKGSLRTWFATIAVRAAQGVIRNETKHRHKDLEYDPEYNPAGCDGAGPTTSTDKASSRRIQALRDAIRTVLTPGEREVIMEDLAAGEGTADTARLAQKLGKSKNSISALRSKARAKLEQFMIREGHYQGTQRSKR